MSHKTQGYFKILLDVQKCCVHFLNKISKKERTSTRTEGWTPPGCQHAVRLSTSCQGERIFFAQTHFLESTNQITQKFPKIKTDESFRVAVKRLSRSCQEAVRWLSGKNHHNFEAKIKFGRWFRCHRRAYSAPSVLTPAKFDLQFRLSRGCSPSETSSRFYWEEPWVHEPRSNPYSRPCSRPLFL